MHYIYVFTLSSYRLICIKLEPETMYDFFLIKGQIFPFSSSTRTRITLHLGYTYISSIAPMIECLILRVFLLTRYFKEIMQELDDNHTLNGIIGVTGKFVHL